MNIFHRLSFRLEVSCDVKLRALFCLFNKNLNYMKGIGKFGV